MNKERIKDIIFVIIIIVLGIFIVLNLFKDTTVTFITGEEELYEDAVNYLIEKDDNENKNKDNYKLFVDYEGFGIAEDEEYKYAYMWINASSYYVENNKLIEGSGYSIPFRFVFSKDNKIIRYDQPEDGRGYSISIKNVYPEVLQEKILNYKADEEKLKEEVNSYYQDILEEK